MADTVITPAAYERDANAAGWAVAVIVLLGVILFGIFVWPGIARTPAGNASTPDAIDVNVQLPQGVQGAGGASGSGGTQQQGTPGTNNPTPAPAQ